MKILFTSNSLLLGLLLTLMTTNCEGLMKKRNKTVKQQDTKGLMKKMNKTVKQQDTEECSPEMEDKCLVKIEGRVTGNKCSKRGKVYECHCNEEQYEEEMESGLTARCKPSREARCNSMQKRACKIEFNGLSTENICTIPYPNNPTKTRCECNDDQFMPDLDDEEKCHIKEYSLENCTDIQHEKCQSDDPGSGNACMILDVNNKDEYVCICHDAASEIKDGNGIVKGCKKGRGCTPSQNILCEVSNITSNKCFSPKKGEYSCVCIPPYEDVIDAYGHISECELPATEACSHVKAVQCIVENSKGEPTGNTCEVPNPDDPDRIRCRCRGKGYREPVDSNERCELDTTAVICSEYQNRQCAVVDADGKKTENSCFIPDPEVDEHECECVPPYESHILPGTSIVQSCTKGADAMPPCDEDQNVFCKVTGKDVAATLNECIRTNLNDPTKYRCKCLDDEYTEVVNEAKEVTNCTRKRCDEVQKEACKVEVNGKITGNLCSLPNPFAPEVHRCICKKPYFPGYGMHRTSICDKLPKGEYYLKKPTQQTVIEGNSVILECVVDRAVNVCQWRRGDRPVNTALNSNFSSSRTKYSLLGKACDGICSLIINSASLSHDNTKWTCMPFLNGSDIPQTSAYISVVVSPKQPWLEYNNQILQEDATVYIPFKHVHTLSIEVKCVSRSAYPPITHSWWKDGFLMEPQPPSVKQQDVMASTFTTTSTAAFILKKSNSTTLQCVATNNDTSDETVMATFGSTAPTTVVKILYLVEDDWLVPPHGVIILDYPEETVLQCDADGHPEPEYSWQERIDKKWQPVGFFESYIVTTHSRTIRCLAGNSDNLQFIASRPVIIQAEGSGGYPGDIPAAVPPFYRFVRQPDSRLIGPGATFILGCQLNGPVHTCLWKRVDTQNKNWGRMPDFVFTGEKDDGYCTIEIMEADEDSLGEWICLPVLHDGVVMQSRKAIISGFHFGEVPDENGDDGWRFKPQLKINNEIVTNRQLVVLNPGEPSKTMVDVLAECNAYARTDAGQVQWKLGNKPYKQFQSNRFAVPSDPPIYLISSKTNFLLTTDFKTANAPQPVLMEIGCKVVGRKILSLVNNAMVDNEWIQIQDHEVQALLTLEHPTRNVALFPAGPVLLGTVGSVLLTCRPNGYPPPTVRWQKYLEKEKLWVTMLDVHGNTMKADTEGHYRCTAGNIINQEIRIASRPVSVERDKDLDEDVTSSSENSYKPMKILWFLTTLFLTCCLSHIICYL